jgi:hypothetical protein
VLKAEPGKVSLRSILNETEKLTTPRKIALPADLFDGYASLNIGPLPGSRDYGARTGDAPSPAPYPLCVVCGLRSPARPPGGGHRCPGRPAHPSGPPHRRPGGEKGHQRDRRGGEAGQQQERNPLQDGHSGRHRPGRAGQEDHLPGGWRADAK